MRLCIFFCFVVTFNVVFGQWQNRVYLEEANTYYYNVMQETIRELERRSFSSLKLLDQTQTLNQQMYKWHVTGNVTYTNGFLVSIQKLDLSNIQQQMSTTTNADGVVQNLASIQGRLNMRDVKIGYDVIAELGEDGDHRFTGTFVHTLIWSSFRIMKNLHTQEITATGSLDSLSGGLDRMIYMPANNITQVISRAYTPSNIWDSVAIWNRDAIVPIILDVAQHKVAFPPVCLDCR